MAVIFSASSDSMSSGRTSRIIGPLLRWLVPGISDDVVGLIVFCVRKAAHVTEYAILSGLLWRAWTATYGAAKRQSVDPDSDEVRSDSATSRTLTPPRWSWADAFIAL